MPKRPGLRPLNHPQVPMFKMRMVKNGLVAVTCQRCKVTHYVEKVRYGEGQGPTTGYNTRACPYCGMWSAIRKVSL